MNTGLSIAVWQEIEAVLQQYPQITACKLYGSRALGNYREGSDIDLAIYGTRLRLMDQLDLANSLEDLGYPYHFDVVIYDNISNRDLKAHIDRHGIDIFKVQENLQ